MMFIFRKFKKITKKVNIECFFVAFYRFFFFGDKFMIQNINDF